MEGQVGRKQGEPADFALFEFKVEHAAVAAGFSRVPAKLMAQAGALLGLA